MTPEDVETLRRAYAAIGRRDWDAVFRDVHADFELKTPDRSPSAGSYRGRAEAARAFEDFFEPYEVVVVEPEEFFRREDRIAVFFVQHARPRGSTATLEIRAAHLWTMRDGKAVRCEIFPERERALEAAGLSV